MDLNRLMLVHVSARTAPVRSTMETQRDQVVEFLMPNGLFASMHCMADENLSRIKARLWKMAREMPLYHRLLEPGRYSFVFINASSEQEEIVDEDLYLGDVRPFGSLFKLAERKGDREEKLQSAKISMLIGEKERRASL